MSLFTSGKRGDKKEFQENYCHLTFLWETVGIEKQIIVREMNKIRHLLFFFKFGTTSLCVGRIRWKWILVLEEFSCLLSINFFQLLAL